MADPFLMNPQALGQMDQVPVRNYTDALQWANGARTADQMTLADMPAAQEAMKQRRAADLAAVLSENRRRDAMSANAELENQGKQRDWQVRDQVPMDQEVRAKLDEYAKTHSAAEIDEAMNKARKMAMSEDPMEAARGKKILDATYEMHKLRTQHELEMEKQKEITKRMLSIADTRLSGTKYTADHHANPGDKPQPGQFEYDMSKARSAGDKIARIEQEIAAIGDDADRQEELLPLYRMRDSLKPQYEREQVDKTMKATYSRNPVTGKIEVHQSGQGVPQTPTPNTSTPPAAKMPPAPQGKVRVKNAQGQMGFVPQEQLQQALKEGYVEVK